MPTEQSDWDISLRPGTPALDEMVHYGPEDAGRLEHEAALRSSRLLRNRLTPEVIEELLAPDIEATDRQMEAYVREAEGQWRARGFEIEVNGLTVETYLRWRQSALFVPAVNIHAHPEHYVHGLVSDEAKNSPAPYMVIEQAGPLTMRLYTKFRPWKDDEPEPWEGALNSTYPDFPIRRVGVLKLKSGTVVGRTLQQYRSTDHGFTFRFLSSNPASVPDAIEHAHMDHAYLEFTRYLAQVGNASLRTKVGFAP